MNLDQIAANVVNGQSFEDVLQAKLEEAHKAIAAKAAALQQKISAAESLGASLPQNAVAELPVTQDILTVAISTLSRKKQALEKAERTKQVFAARHSLSRPPNAPDWVVTLLGLSVMVFVEGGVNAAFFLNAHMAASPGSALLTSSLISATNVMVSACGGYFIGRSIGYGAHAVDGHKAQFKTKRWMAKAAFCALAGTLGWFHLTVGLIRAQEELALVRHSLQSYMQVLTTPEALFLVLIGAAMSVLSWAKGKNGFDDPYPHYGAMQRRVDDLQDDCLDAYEQAGEDMAARFEEAAESCEAKAKTTAKLYTQYNEAIKQCVQAEKQFRAKIHQVEKQLRAEVSQMMSLYAAHQKTINPDIAAHIEKACTLGSNLVFALPAYRQPPDTNACKARLHAAQEDALQELTQIFQNETP